MRHDDHEWAASGAMALTGKHDGSPLLAPAPFASSMRATVAALAAAARKANLDPSRLTDVDAGALLGERAACSGFERRGATSPGASCDLVRCADGWIAVNLAREDDAALVAAWLEMSAEGPLKDFIAREARTRSVTVLVERARLLGMAVCEVAQPPKTTVPWLGVTARGPGRRRGSGEPPLIIDLSSLWAGPLATHLLVLCGARVIKVESTRRPDGARSGAAAFYDLLNAGKRSVALDFASAEGRRLLGEMIARADIVVESSRPRALAQLGIDAEALVEATPGLVWVSITGYGRDEPCGNWVAFGDDASAGAGVVMAMAALHGEPLFCGDAIADPLSGSHAALAALAQWTSGEAALLDLSLRNVTAHVLSTQSQAGRATVRPCASPGGEPVWEVAVDGEQQIVCAPRARPVTEHARSLGADTMTMLRELGIPC